ncbi:NADH:flavin oxidoreductase [uncultured Phenylobacterium sp.]|uniref:NADH:flavin oxidoreductase n=1 Tax=uncultured Phenylobacterium sp. TaxID=349273 RepID=UPI0025CFE352|nr:NADH:flavin oxidoreductase [uncultured Phenylobacterium sp.]
MTDLFAPLTFLRGPAMANRLMLSPMTSDQALPDGRVTEDEVRWLDMRAAGGFGGVMTSASYVQAQGKGGQGQTGIWSDDHVEGLSGLARTIKSHGRLAALQLHHAGYRASRRSVPQPVGPSDDPESGSRGLTTAEVEQLVEDFVAGARRAEQAGFDGVELHGAHGYLLAQFLSAEDNRRTDRYGGSLENRARLTLEIIDGVRRTCRTDFQLGLRLSPERYGMRLGEVRDLAAEVMAGGELDWLDLSLWDANKAPVEAGFQERPLFAWFTDLPRHGVRLGVAGKIMTPVVAAGLLEAGADFVLIGRAAILHHDWPMRARRDPGFEPASLPVSAEHLASEGLGARFIRYVATFDNFVIPA